MTTDFKTLLTEAVSAVSEISVREAYDLHSNGTAIFVDPRPADAIATTTGIIPGAVNVTLDSILNGELPIDFDDHSISIITCCQAGPMGAVAAHALSKLGFLNVRYMAGGTQAWLDAGHQTHRRVREREAPTLVGAILRARRWRAVDHHTS